MDDFFHCDFLLTYRSFLPSAQPIIDTVKTMWEEGQPWQRERVGVVVGWVWYWLEFTLAFSRIGRYTCILAENRQFYPETSFLKAHKLPMYMYNILCPETVWKDLSHSLFGLVLVNTVATYNLRFTTAIVTLYVHCMLWNIHLQ